MRSIVLLLLTLLVQTNLSWTQSSVCNSKDIATFLNSIRTSSRPNDEKISALWRYAQCLEAKKCSSDTLYRLYYGAGDLLIGNHKMPKESIPFLTKALQNARKLKDKLKEASTIHWLAWAYFQQAQLEEAIRHFLDARDIYIQLGRKSDEANLVMHLGDFYFEMGDAKTALNHYREAIALRPPSDNPKLFGFHYLNLGQALIKLDSLEEAEKAFKSAYLYDSSVHIKHLVTAYEAKMFKTKGDIKRAMIHYNIALPYIQKTDPGGSYIEFATEYAECCIAEQLFKMADSTCMTAISSIKPASLLHHLARLYFVHSIALKNLGQTAAALEASITGYNYLNDFAYESGLTGVQNLLLALTKGRSEAEKAELNAIVDRAKYEKEAEEKKNNIVLWAGVGMLVLSLSLTILAVNLKKSRKKLSVQNELLHHKTTELSKNQDILTAKEYRMRQIMSRSNMAYCVVSREGRIIDINDAMKPYVELENKDHLIGKNIKEVFNEHLTRLFAYTMSSLKHKPFVSAEVEVILNNQETGKELLLAGNITNLLDDPTVKAFTFQATDVTSFVEAERFEKEILRARVELNQKEITKISTQYIANQNLLIEQARTLEQIEKELRKENSQGKDDLIKLIKNATIRSRNSNKFWEDYKRNFNMGFNGFYERLALKHPNLTIQEQRHCAFIRMNMSSKETAAITGSSIDAVKKARTRLKKRIGLKLEQSLYEYFSKL